MSGEKSLTPRMQVAATVDGGRYGLLGEPGPAPAPLLFVFASALETSLGTDPYNRTALQLLRKGFLCASLDLPCHGQDQRPGEPAGLWGWRARLDQGEDFVAPFTAQVSRLLDHLIGTGGVDPRRVAACGTSRGGFAAAHAVAADPRIRAAALFAPVTALPVLNEFAGLENHPLAAALSLVAQAPRLASRALWVSIGHRDQRVGTDHCIAFCRQVVAAGGEQPADCALQVLPAEGHQTPAGAYEEAAGWISARL